MRVQYLQEIGYNVIEKYECDWWRTYKTDIIFEQHLHECFSHQMALREERLLENLKTESHFGYVQCDIEVPEKLRDLFANFPSILKNINDSRHDIGSFI